MPILTPMDFSTPIKNSIDIDSDIPIQPIAPTTPKYIPDKELVRLRKKNLTYREIGKQVGISKHSVAIRFKRLNKEMELTNYHINNRTHIFGDVERRATEAITDAKFRKANLFQITNTVERFHTMGRLETGQSTQNIAYADALKAQDLAGTEQDQLKKDYPHIDFNLVTINVTP